MGSQLNVISYLNIIRPTSAIQSKQTSSEQTSTATLFISLWKGPDLHCAVGLFLPGPSATQFLVKLSEVVNGHQSPGSCMCIWIMLYVGGPELRHSAVLGGGDKGALI